MNAAHLHLVINHLPVVGLLFGLGILLIGQFIRSGTTVRVGLWSLLATGITAIPAYMTGEPAEEIIEHLPGIAKPLIERHENAAVFGLAGAIVAGALAAAALFLWRKDRPIPAWAALAMIAISLLSAGSMAWTAKLGGEIRHPEIRQAGGEPSHLTATHYNQ